LNRETAFGAAFLAALALVPLFADDFYLTVLGLIFLYAYLGQAWNIMMGFAGQLSLGHALYFGVGGYAVVVLAQKFGISPWATMALGFLLAAALGAVVGALGFRFAVRGTYFALLTVAFAELVRILFEHWGYVGGTGGFFLQALRPDNVPLASLRGGARFFYYALLVTMAAGWAVAMLLLYSRVGYFWRAIREDEDSARALGVPAFRLKVLAVAISAGMTGIGGGWFALMGGSLYPETMLGMRMSIDVLVAPIVGGLGTLFGPILGAFIIVPLNEVSKHVSQAYGINGLNLLIYGLLLMAVVIFAPHGVWPWIARRLRMGAR
jgi:branched-chain amino acid transport system permease protein